jgi:hypothetical protein
MATSIRTFLGSSTFWLTDMNRWHMKLSLTRKQWRPHRRTHCRQYNTSTSCYLQRSERSSNQGILILFRIATSFASEEETSWITIVDTYWQSVSFVGRNLTSVVDVASVFKTWRQDRKSTLWMRYLTPGTGSAIWMLVRVL